MTDDTRLSTLLKQAAGEPPKVIGMTEVRRRARHQRAVILMSVLGVVLGVLAVGITVPLVLANRPAAVIVPVAPSPSSAATTAPAPTASPTPTGETATAACEAGAMAPTLIPTGAAAGTIRWEVRLTNTAGQTCTSDGYPTLQFHVAAGWLAPTLDHGGYGDISGAPTEVSAAPGQALHFIVYWSDVTSDSGGCRSFDQVRVGLPGGTTTATVSGTGCINPDLVEVGPVSAG